MVPFGLTCLQVSLQTRESPGPEHTVLVKPGIDFPQRFRLEPAQSNAALLLLDYEPRLTEDTQLLGDGGSAHGETRRDLTDRLGPSSQDIEDRPPSSIGQSTENGLC